MHAGSLLGFVYLHAGIWVHGEDGIPWEGVAGVGDGDGDGAWAWRRGGEEEAEGYTGCVG